MEARRVIDRKHQFRLVLFGHKAVETGAACLLLMLQGQLAEATLGHFLLASKTGALTVFPLLGITWTRHAKYLANRWTSSALVGTCAFFADAVIHGSHYPGKFTEAALTGLAAFALSLIISYTGIGKRIDRLAEAFLH